MTEPITVLGATGSIGRSTLDVVKRYDKRFHIHALAGGSRVEPLVEAAAACGAKHLVIADESKFQALKDAACAAGLKGVTLAAGSDAVTALASDPESGAVVQAIVGAAGWNPRLPPRGRASDSCWPIRKVWFAAAHC